MFLLISIDFYFRSPIKYNLVKAISFCDPAVITDTRVSLLRLKNTLTIFNEHNWISGYTADGIERNFIMLFKNNTFMQRAKLYNRNNTRLDTFWIDISSEYELSDGQLDLLKMVSLF